MPACQSWHFFKKICQIYHGIISETSTLKIIIKKYKIMVLNIKPLSDRVLIEPVAAETKLLQGFYSRYC
jgi:hypothetical protein